MSQAAKDADRVSCSAGCDEIGGTLPSVIDSRAVTEGGDAAW